VRFSCDFMGFLGQGNNRNPRQNDLMKSIVNILRANEAYPDALAAYLGSRSPEAVYSLGNLDILRHKMLALFCSVKCPGNLILKTYDLARELRNAEVTIISGFHSPMEKECFSILLQGRQPLVWCLARRLTPRGIPGECSPALAEGRLLILSPFDEKTRRTTAATALFRNEFAAALADKVFVAYAAPGSKTESFCRQVLEWDKPLLTFDAPDNAALLSLGVRPIRDAASVMEGMS